MLLVVLAAAACSACSSGSASTSGSAAKSVHGSSTSARRKAQAALNTYLVTQIQPLLNRVIRAELAAQPALVAYLRAPGARAGTAGREGTVQAWLIRARPQLPGLRA
jgi:hypothetical protein